MCATNDGCTSLTSITLPVGLASIGRSAFYRCTSLPSITLPDGLASISTYAFSGCSNLTSITLPDGITGIENYTFLSCTGLTSITLPDELASIGRSVFDGCTSLSSIILPDGLASIGTFAFRNCKSLSSVILPNGLTSIENNVFDGCSNISSVIFPDGLTKIGDYTFRNCTNLSSLTLPDGLTQIGDRAFDHCTSIEAIHAYPLTPPSITSNTFSYVPKNIPVYVPKGAVDTYKAADGWSDFPNIKNFTFTLHDKETYTSSRDFLVDEFTYTRTFSNNDVWQCWYVPFEVEVDESKFKAAEIAGILFDNERNAVVAFNKLNDGAVLKANTPYVVKAVTANLELDITDVTLYAAEENTFTIQSAYDDFTFGGIYSEQSDASWYTLNKTGDFQALGSATLKPQRFWMSVTPRQDGPYNGSSSASAKQMIQMMVIGDDETTGIGQIENEEMRVEYSAIYNLNGQKVSSFQSGQVYIINGKKFIAK